jgi:hypothetical protein
MTSKQKLIQALAQIENLKTLLEGNEYQKYFYGHFVKVGVELKRQLNNYGKTTD